jgi:hypothetical protein
MDNNYYSYIPGRLPKDNTENKSKNKKRKIFIIIGIVIGIIVFLFGLFLLLPSILGLFSKDIPTVDDSDLQLKTIVVAEQDNAYYDLSMAKENIVLSGDDYSLIKKYAKNEEWNATSVQDILSKNEQLFIYLDQAVQKPEYQDPELAIPENFSISMKLLAMRSLPDISKLSAMKAIYLAKGGKGAEALDEAIHLLDIAKKIKASQSCMIYYLTAISIDNTGLDTIQRVLQIVKISPDILSQYSEKLELFKGDREWLSTAFKADYATAKEAVNIIASGKGDNFLPDQPIYFNINSKSSFYFQPNKTKMIFANNTRLAI